MHQSCLDLKHTREAMFLLSVFPSNVLHQAPTTSKEKGAGEKDKTNKQKKYPS